MDCINIIKNQYFSQQNLEFILQLINNKKIESSLIHEITFRIQNDIYNTFIHNIARQKKNINPNSIEELLVTLNKMTIESIKNEIEAPSQLRKYKNFTEPEQSYESSYPVQKDLNEKSYVEHGIQTDNIQTLNIQAPIIQKNIQSKNNFIHFFSADNSYNNGVYKFEIRKTNIKSITIRNFELYNNLYNITEHNNKIELSESSLKTNITLSVGCYDIHELIEHIKKQFNDKSGKQITYDISYNKNKNKINISSDKQFNIRFIENNVANIVPLRFILGFSKSEYINNNNYTSDKEPIIDIYNNIYIKVQGNDTLNTQVSKNFNYYSKLNIDYLHTFGNNVICLKEFILDNLFMDIDDLDIELYYRHNAHNNFYKITKEIIFNFTLELNYDL